MGKLEPLTESATAESIVAKKGTTTTNGAVNGSTVVDSALTEANDYWNDMTILILSGVCKGQSRDITDFAGGTLTVSPVFASRILSGVRYFILPIKPSAAEVEDIKGTGFVKDTDSLVDLAHADDITAIDGLLDDIIADIGTFPTANYATLAAYVEYVRTQLIAIKAETDKILGVEGEDTVTALNAHGGTASSGDTGADVLTISTSTRKKIHFLGIDISGLTDAAKATIRAYTKVLDADASLTKFYDEDFTVGTDPDLIPFINGTIGIRNDLRIEIQSDNDSDTSVDVKYCYVSEDME